MFRFGPLVFAGLIVAVGLAGCLGGSLEGSFATSFGDATGIAFTNGVLWTADDERPWATALAVVGDRIVAVGSDEEILRVDLGPRPLRVDLAGALVTPGFHDTHNHFVREAMNWDPATRANPFEPWPPGWDPVAGTVAQQNRAAGHLGTWANRNVERVRNGALPALPSEHVHEETVAVPCRLAQTDLDCGDAPQVGAAAQREGLRLAFATAAKYGVTSHVEAGASFDRFEALEAYDRDVGLTARYNLYVFPEDLESVIQRGWVTGSGDDDVRLLGMKIYSDGWLGPRTAAMRDLYNDRPHRGVAFFTQEEVDGYVLHAHQNGLKVTAHTIGDRATAMLLDAYAKASAQPCEGHAVCADPRWSLEHVQLVQPDLMEKMVELRLVPSVQLSFATSDAPWAESALGRDRLQHAYPWRTMLERGLVVGGSSDFPIEVLPPLWGIQRVVTRVDLDGKPAGGFMPEQALTLDEALRTITINAAYLEFREDELGSLTPGKYADFVVLGRNLFEIPPEEIAVTPVLLTVVGGRPAHAAAPFDETFAT